MGKKPGRGKSAAQMRQSLQTRKNEPAKVYRPRAVLSPVPKQSDYERGKADADQENRLIQDEADKHFMAFVDLLVIWRLNCHTVDAFKKAKFAPKQLQTVIDSSLKKDIQASYDKIIETWDDWSDQAREATGYGFPAFDTLRPDMKAATDSRIQAIEALHKGDVSLIRSLTPIDPHLLASIRETTQLGRNPVSDDILTRDAQQMYADGFGSYAKIAIVLQSRYDQELKTCDSETRRKALEDALHDLKRSEGKNKPGEPDKRGEMLRLRLSRIK